MIQVVNVNLNMNQNPRIYRAYPAKYEIRRGDLISLDSTITLAMEGYISNEGKPLKALMIECDRPFPGTKLAFVNPEYIDGLKSELGPLEEMIGQKVEIYVAGNPFLIRYGLSKKIKKA